uniref:Uncharacterized protein n=1 Tax=Timema bartmani TaxID=61472 RepID=A0A7R9EWV2_9NEOP|nr:unnamed protein product [Timema bartmani]
MNEVGLRTPSFTVMVKDALLLFIRDRGFVVNVNLKSVLPEWKTTAMNHMYETNLIASTQDSNFVFPVTNNPVKCETYAVNRMATSMGFNHINQDRLDRGLGRTLLKQSKTTHSVHSPLTVNHTTDLQGYSYKNGLFEIVCSSTQPAHSSPRGNPP